MTTATATKGANGRKKKTREVSRADRNIAWIETHLRVPEGSQVGRPMLLRKWQRDIMRGIYDEANPLRRAIISFGRKNGKALALDTPIATVDGWRTLAEIEPGNEVFGSDGAPVLVLATSDVFTDKPCYRLRFSDGSEITASADHLWDTTHSFRPWARPRINSSGNGGRWLRGIVTTQQISESVLRPTRAGIAEFNHGLTVAGAVQMTKSDLPIPAYALGVWLGDGTSSKAEITVGDADKDALRAELESEGISGIRVRENRDRASTLCLTSPRGSKGTFQARLRSLGVIGNKHIPEMYFAGSIEQRWSLLQGLMDTDGTVSLCGGGTATPRCDFGVTSDRLAFGVWRLVRSLGLKATTRIRDAKLNGRVVGKATHVSFAASSAHPVFRLWRKQRLLPNRIGKRSSTIKITACDPVSTVPTKCLMVDSEDSLFLAGYGCIPTHNTALSACLLLLHLAGPEAKANAQLYSDAQSRDQASLIFNLAAKMVRMSPELSQYVVIRDTAKQLFCPELGAMYRALSADASTAFGLSPAFIVHDELGQVRGPRSALYEALETATAAQESPLSIVISTQAPNDDDLLSVLIDDALGGHDPRTKVWLFTSDPEADPFAVETIRQANPAFGDFQNEAEVLAMAEDARRMPSREAEYRNLVLNQRVETSSPFVSRSVWDANGAEPAVDWPADAPVYAGLDLSYTTDLTAFVPAAVINGEVHVCPIFWTPAEGLVERARQDRAPYDLWVQQGFLKTTPGRNIEYAFVAQWLVDFCAKTPVRKIAFDRFGFKHLRPWLIRAGMSEEAIDTLFVEFGQGYKDMSPAVRAVEALLLAGKIRHGGHPVLSSCVAQAIVKIDEAGNRKFDKKKAGGRGRIDGLVALAMAASLAEADLVEPESVYATRGIRSIGE